MKLCVRPRPVRVGNPTAAGYLSGPTAPVAMRHHYVTAWLQLDALDSPVLMGVTDGQTPPVWTFGEALEPEQRRKLQQILDTCWRDVGGHVGRNTIADMLAALEVASVELVLRLVVPGETEHAMTRQVLELEQGVPTAA